MLLRVVLIILMKPFICHIIRVTQVASKKTLYVELPAHVYAELQILDAEVNGLGAGR